MAALDRAAILTDAHRRCRWARAQVTRISGKLDPYSRTLSWCLRAAWQAAREDIRAAAAADALSALEEAEADAVLAPTPRNVIARINALRRFAEAQPFTIHGREARRSLLAEADVLALAARAMMIPATQDHAHAAH